jgi:hypothetical protein
MVAAETRSLCRIPVQKFSRMASGSWRDVPVPIVRFKPEVIRPKLAGEVNVAPRFPASMRFEMFALLTRADLIPGRLGKSGSPC